MNKKPLKFTLVISLVVAALVSQSAQADTKTWSSSNGFWDNDSNWLPFGVPGAGDDVIVSPYGGVDTILNFASATGSRSANSLVVNSGTDNAVSFLQTGSSLSITNRQIIGSTGSGNYMLSGGSNTSGELVVGEQSGSNGNYNLSGSGSLSTNKEYIGSGGTGTFTQNGGTHSVSDYLRIGSYYPKLFFYGGVGSYNLNDGSLSANRENIGDWGIGTFIQSGGTNTVNGLGIGTGDSDGTGNYILSGGSLSARSESIAGPLHIGTFTQSGGTNTMDGLTIGTGASDVGTGTGFYDLSGGSFSANRVILGVGGNGTFTQSGGTSLLSGDLILGIGSYPGPFGGGAGGGNYNLSGGSLSASNEIIGEGSYGGGGFTQSGGMNTIVEDLILGNRFDSGGDMYDSVYSSGSGCYDLSDGSLSADREVIGNYGTGVFTQSGGTNTVGSLILGNNTSLDYLGNTHFSTGSYNLSGGSLSAGTEIVGNSGIGSFTQSGGTNTADNLIIGTMGSLVGDAGSAWHITSSFENHSLQNTLWNTDHAELFFDGSGIKSLYLAGIDEGLSPLGFTNNFAFGLLSLASGAELNIYDGNATAGAALYVELLNLADGVNQLGSIHSDYNIYYNASLAGNAYLMHRTYALDGGGFLMAAVPEPETYAMLLAGLGVLGFAARRRKQSTKRLS